MTTGLVIGCASFDTLHIRGETYHTIGGAGLYTALAAARVGAAVTLVAPKPDPIPTEFVAAANYIRWIGPLASLASMPQLEIAHHGGGQATLIGAGWGAEADLTPQFLPTDLSTYDFVHIAALSSAARQLEFLRACRERGAQRVSVGTYARLVYSDKDTVHTLFAESDVFFMNENEARGLLGEEWRILHLSVDKRPRSGLYFVTMGERGVVAVEGDSRQAIEAVPANELDPTGAGDTFCGCVLGLMAQSQRAVEAATQGAQWAARVIEAPGPAVLIS